MGAYRKKRDEPCALFLEDAWAESHAERLRQAGFPKVVRFIERFPDLSRKVEQAVKDPRLIRLCDTEKMLLVTTDSNMHKTHTEQIKTTTVAILATAHNNADYMNDWTDAIIRKKAAIERYFRRHARPWFATISREGNINIVTIDETWQGRRNRPREMEVATDVIREERG